MNIVIYARFSSHTQNEQSIEGQIKECYAFAKRNDYIVIAEYIDRGLSGTTDNRPEFQKMIEDSSKKYFEGILVYQLDRFARNRYDSAIYKSRLKKNGVRVLSARENISDDASGILVEGLLESMAEYYSAELSQKVKRGMDMNAEKCLCTGGNIALGYRVDNEKKFQIDDNTAPIVEKIFDMYASGKTVAQINAHLNEMQIRTARGGAFNKNSLRKILTNKRYIGIYTYKGTEIVGGMPAIISDEKFERVQGIIKKNKIAPARARAKEEYILTTKLFCGHCKDMMTGSSSTSKTGKIHNYYTCKKVKIKQCNKRTVRKAYIENRVIEECRKLLTDENIAMITKEVIALCEKEKDNSNLKRLQKLLKDNEKQRSNLFEALKICDIDIVKKSIFEEIAKMESVRTELQKQITFEEVEHIDLTVPEIKFFLTHLRKGDVNDIVFRKMLINIFVIAIYLYDDKLTLILNVGDRFVEIDDKILKEIDKDNEGFKSAFIGNVAPPSKPSRLSGDT